MNENILLHVCCGPCAEYPLDVLIEEEGLRPMLYFYNPNIHPRVEWRRRLQNLLVLAEKRGLPCLVEPDFEQDKWMEYDPSQNSGLSRCQMCYQTRLSKTAAKAKDLGIGQFTTTLLVSPYQDHEELVRQGLSAGIRHDVSFLVRDFRPGFRDGQQKAREDGLYRQKYCGCMISLNESKFKDKIMLEQLAIDSPE